MAEAVPIECWSPEMCEHKQVATTNETTTVEFDKITSPDYTENCKCVKERK